MPERILQMHLRVPHVSSTAKKMLFQNKYLVVIQVGILLVQVIDIFVSRMGLKMYTAERRAIHYTTN